MATVLVTGGSGFLGSVACAALCARGHDVLATYASHPERVPVRDHIDAVQLRLDESHSIDRVLRESAPNAVLHFAAMSELAACEREPANAEAINVGATRAIAAACRHLGAVLLFASTDQVFDGEGGPYGEFDDARPIHVYGRTKLRAESEVAALGNLGLSLRISLVYGASPTGVRSASEQIVTAAVRGDSSTLFLDEFRTPVLADDVALATVELMERMLAADAVVPGGERVLHLGGPERMSRYEFGVHVMKAFGLHESMVSKARRADVELGAPRPRDVALDSSLARRVVRTRIRSVGDGLAALIACRTNAPMG